MIRIHRKEEIVSGRSVWVSVSPTRYISSCLYKRTGNFGKTTSTHLSGLGFLSQSVLREIPISFDIRRRRHTSNLRDTKSTGSLNNSITTLSLSF